MPPPTGVRRLETSRAVRRTATLIAFVLVCWAIAVVACAAWVLFRFGALYPVDHRWLLYLSVSVAVLSPLWTAYFLYLPAHTVLEFTSVSLRLTRSVPFREWSGPWRGVKQAYLHKGFFAIETTEGLWQGWAVRVAPADIPLVDELRLYLGAGVWVDGRRATLRLAGRVFLVHASLLAFTLFGVGLVHHIEKVLR
jgi:hypothetical protein